MRRRDSSRLLPTKPLRKSAGVALLTLKQLPMPHSPEMKNLHIKHIDLHR